MGRWHNNGADRKYKFDKAKNYIATKKLPKKTRKLELLAKTLRTK